MLLPALLLVQDAPPVKEAFLRAPEMTTGSWILLLAAWIFVSGLLIWSFKKVLGGP